MKTTRRLSVSARYVWEVQNISFLYYCDVNDIIDRTHTHKNNKIEQEQEVNSFFTAMNQQTSSYFHSS